MPTLSPSGVHVSALQPSLIPAVRSFLANALKQATDRRLTQDDMAIIVDAVRRTDDKVEELQVAEQGILRDRATSDEGKSAALVVLAEKHVEKFRSLGKQIEQADASLREYEEQLYGVLRVPAKESDAMRLIRELRAREIRGSVVGDTHDTTFLLALEKGDLETVLALLDAPGGSLVSDEVLQRGKVAYAQRTNKALYAKWQSVEYRRERLRGIANFVAQMLRRLGARSENIAAALGEAE